jgi:hypothetical protein
MAGRTLAWKGLSRRHYRLLRKSLVKIMLMMMKTLNYCSLFSYASGSRPKEEKNIAIPTSLFKPTAILYYA